MEKNYYIVFKYNKLTKKIEYKTFKSFKKDVHNSNNNTYYYFNFNIQSGLWEHEYCQKMKSSVNKAFKNVKNMKFIIDIFNMYKTECMSTEENVNELKQKYNLLKNEQERTRFEQNDRYFRENRIESYVTV